MYSYMRVVVLVVLYARDAGAMDECWTQQPQPVGMTGAVVGSGK